MDMVIVSCLAALTVLGDADFIISIQGCFFLLSAFPANPSAPEYPFQAVELRRCRTLHLEFDEAPPAQMDGELIEGTSFDIAVEPAALNVLVPF